jgi:hypothetical protein
VAVTVGSHADAAASDRFQTVLDCVFHQREEQHRWKFNVFQQWLRLDRERQARAHADLQQIEVRTHQFELASKRGALASELRQRGTQIAHQAGNCYRTGLWLSAIQTPHVPYVKQVRFDLGLDSAKYCSSSCPNCLRDTSAACAEESTCNAPVGVGNKYEENGRGVKAQRIGQHRGGGRWSKPCA